MDLTPHQRLAAAALADRIVYGDPATYRAEDAQALLGVLPAPGWGARLLALLPGMGAKGSFTGPGLSGAGAGGAGPLRMEGEERSFEVDTHGVRVHRAGQWKLSRGTGPLGAPTLTIAQVMGDKEAEARLRFSDGRPGPLLRGVERPLTIGPVTLALVVFAPWKTPTFGVPPAEGRHAAPRGQGRGGLAFRHA